MYNPQIGFVMTLPSSGTIKFSNIRTELSRSAGTAVKLSESAVRSLAGKPSGQISIKNLYGKSVTPPITPNASLGLSSSTYTNEFQSSAAVRLFVEVSGRAYIQADVNETGNWASGAVNDGAYEVRYTVQSGTTPDTLRTITNDASSWTTISAAAGSIVFEARARIASTTSQQSVSCNATFRVEIRLIGTTTNIIDQTLTFMATASPINIG